MITAVFTVFALSFMVISANTTKQNDIREQNSQSVAIAEMGITYFEQAVRNSVTTHEKLVLDEVKALRAAHASKNTILLDSQYIDYGRDLMMRYLEEDINSLNPEVYIKTKTSSKFLIEPINSKYLNSKPQGFEVTYKSTGTENSKATAIEGNLIVDLSRFMSSNISSGDSGGTSIIEANKIQDPGDLNNCNTSGKKIIFSNIQCQIIDSVEFEQNDNLSFDKSTVKIKGSLTMKNANNAFTESTLYIENDMTAGNLNSLSNIKLYIGGTLKGLHFNGSGLSNSTVEIKKTASMDNIKLKGSTMFIGEGLTTIQQINEMESSILFINGDTKVTQGINLGNNSLICVNGDLQISNNVNNNSNGTSKIYAISSNHSSVNTTSNDFTKACFNASTSKATWGNITLSSEYNYNYK